MTWISREQEEELLECTLKWHQYKLEALQYFLCYCLNKVLVKTIWTEGWTLGASQKAKGGTKTLMSVIFQLNLKFEMHITGIIALELLLGYKFQSNNVVWKYIRCYLKYTDTHISDPLNGCKIMH